MNDLPEPLTPANCDLREYPFLPFEVKRLLTSETWILGNGEERAAAIALWLESWHQIPAASLPDNDRMLEHLSQSKKWKGAKTHALRGWVKCSDGRLYHATVAEKALEGWIGKLLSSLSGSAGNAKRWGIEVDTDAVKDQIVDAVKRLRAIAPQSEILKKTQVRNIVSGSHPDSPPDKKSIAPRSENISHPDSPPDRNREGEGEREGDTKPRQQHNHGPQSRALPDGETERHVQVAVLLRSLGVMPMTGAHPMAMAFASTGATDEQLRAAVEIARERKPAPQPISPNYLQPILDEVLAPPEMRQPKKRDAWWVTNESMVAKARELGIREANPGEYPHEFKARIQAAIDAQGRVAA